MELISSDGEFNEADFENFLESAKLDEHGTSSYVTIAIIGHQSTGKSTLMNQLFRTNFMEMNARLGRVATTKGIWMEKAPQMVPLTIALDLEGTDSRERGEDDKTFERRSALFAAVIADILIINMNCQNVGQDQGGNRPLLKIIFEAMTHLFGPHKITLFFVLRNIKEVSTSIEMLENELREDVDKIWKSALKPPGHENTPLSQIINVKVAALSSYLTTPATFKNEVARLKSQLYDSIKRHNVVPVSEAISFTKAKITWDTIKEYKDLDLPSLKVMVATVRCEEVARDKLRLLQSDKEWLALEEAAASSLVSDFSTKICRVLDKYLSQYDSECIKYENDVRRAKREYLMSEVSKVVRNAYTNTLNHRRTYALRSFDAQLNTALSGGGRFAESVQACKQSCESQFDRQCGSDDPKFSNLSDVVSATRRELVRDIENKSLLVRDHKLLKIVEEQRERVERLGSKFARQLRYLVNDTENDDIWGCIRSVLRSESDAVALALSSALADFEVDQPTVEKMVDDLGQSAKELMVKKFKEETQDVVVTLLKRRFVTALLPTNSARNETEEVIQPTKESAYIKCVKLLSTMAVIRLDEREGECKGNDRVESVLLRALVPPAADAHNSPDPLDSLTWEQEEVPPIMTLITPARCKDIWNQFKLEMDECYATTMFVQEKLTGAKNWQRYTWVILGLLALGLGVACGGYFGFMFLIRVTNIEVVLSLDCAMKAIATAAAALDLVTKGIGVVKEWMKLWKAASEAPNITEFCRKFRNILRGIKKALRKLLRRINSILAKRESTMMTA